VFPRGPLSISTWRRLSATPPPQNRASACSAPEAHGTDAEARTGCDPVQAPRRVIPVVTEDESPGLSCPLLHVHPSGLGKGLDELRCVRDLMRGKLAWLCWDGQNALALPQGGMRPAARGCVRCEGEETAYLSKDRATCAMSAGKHFGEGVLPTTRWSGPLRETVAVAY
jgi:hypothetical protein